MDPQLVKIFRDNPITTYETGLIGHNKTFQVMRILFCIFCLVGIPNSILAAMNPPVEEQQDLLHGLFGHKEPSVMKDKTYLYSWCIVFSVTYLIGLIGAFYENKILHLATTVLITTFLIISGKGTGQLEAIIPVTIAAESYVLFLMLNSSV